MPNKGLFALPAALSYLTHASTHTSVAEVLTELCNPETREFGRWAAIHNRRCDRWALPDNAWCSGRWRKRCFSGIEIPEETPITMTTRSRCLLLWGKGYKRWNVLSSDIELPDTGTSYRNTRGRRLNNDQDGLGHPGLGSRLQTMECSLFKY